MHVGPGAFKTGLAVGFNGCLWSKSILFFVTGPITSSIWGANKKQKNYGQL
jgi:hypothetical protein